MFQLGIDFGTSFTKAAVYEVGSNNNYCPVPLCNIGANRKDRSIPTVAYVSSDGKKITIGDEAINSKKNPNGDFIDNFKPEIDSINEVSSERRDLLRRIITTFLREIKSKAKSAFGQDFNDVVITIPASSPKDGVRYYNMERCAQRAGFHNILIIPEPVAAAYYLLGDRVRSTEMSGKLFLIYDFGGGTFDTSIIKISDEQIQVIDESVGSDNEQQWGGMYIDAEVGKDYRRRSDYAKRQVAIISDRNSSFEQILNASDHLREYPIRIKIELSKKEVFASPYSYSLTREQFESMIKNMVDNTIETTLSLLDNAHKDKLCEDIYSVERVFLVGGTSQIPLVSSRWKFIKSSKDAKFDISINPNLNAIALGAARYRELRLSPQELIEKGKKYFAKKDYKKAAAYFNNAGNDEGLFYYGLLFYLGVIGRKRQPARAYKIFEEANYKYSYLMMSLMRFNNDGVLKDDRQACKLLSHSPESNLKSALERVLNGGRSSDDFNTIYNFDARSLF